MKLRKEVKLILGGLMMLLLLITLIVKINKEDTKYINDCINQGYTKKSCQVYNNCIATGNYYCNLYLTTNN